VRRMLWLLALALPLAIGCGSNDDDDDAATGTGGTSGGGSAGAAGDATVPSVCDVDTPYELEDISGRWAYLEVQSLLVTSSFTGDFSNRVVSLQLFEVSQNGTELSIEASWCDRFVVDPEAPVRAVLPAEFVAALTDATLEGSYSQDAEGAWHFEVPTWYQSEGAELEDITDPELLPTEPDDPAVVDQDQDGQPGMTVELQGVMQGSTYVVQWARLSLDGIPVSDDRIQGALDFDAREIVLASEPAMIRDLVEPSTPNLDGCASFFVLVRLPEDADCATINEQRETLFPELPH
jgi:hypothetical protein